MLTIEVTGRRRLRFDDGSPVRAASAVAPLGDGWLVAQDDAVHAAWVRPPGTRRLRLLPPVDGHDVFSSTAGTKHLKPDLEAACPVRTAAGGDAVLLLGSGSTPARMRAVLVAGAPEPRVQVAELPALYAEVAGALGIGPAELNLEGAARCGDVLRWFARGNLVAGVPSRSVDLEVAALVAAVQDPAAPPVRLGEVRSYDLGEVAGVGLAVTDAVALPDGRLLVSAAAEDTPNAVDDGPVVGTALALLDGERVLASSPLPRVDGAVAKVEGLALLAADDAGAALLAVSDEDDPELASAEMRLRVSWT